MIRRLLYVGTMQTPDACARNPWASEAMNVTQLSLMEAFHRQGVQEVIGLSFPGSSAWRNPQRLKPYTRSHWQDGITIHELPFIALGPLQPLSQILSYIAALLYFLWKCRPNVILITNPLTRWCLPALIMGRVFRLPILIMATDYTPHNNFRQKMELQMLRWASGVVVFSSHLGRDLRGSRPWIRIVRPPAPDLLRLSPTHTPSTDSCIFYFAGSTAEVSGIPLLLEAIRLLPESHFVFWFSGRGTLDSLIQAAAQHDPRISHWGFVSQADYHQRLQAAHVLLNPRPSHLPENRYNFPSKLMDYLAAGKPIISTLTSDVAEYYREAIIPLEDESPQGLAACMRWAANLSDAERETLAQRSHAYARAETWEQQAQHILDFMESL